MTPPISRVGPASIGRFAVLLVGVAFLLAGVRWTLTSDLGQRNYEYFPDMAVSPALESQSLASRLPGGLSQQALVAGVIPRGRLPFRFGAGEEELVRAGRELDSPLAAGDGATLARGAEVYRIHCVSCHDAGGGGHGPAVLRGMLPPPPFTGASAMQLPDGSMFHVLTLGRGNMPPMSGRLDAADRWAVIQHVRLLQSAPKDEAPVAPPPEEDTK